jgi:predicted amidohydrolase YtcJ
VLDRNLFETPPAEINEASVLLTLFDGRPVYNDGVCAGSAL